MAPWDLDISLRSPICHEYRIISRKPSVGCAWRIRYLPDFPPRFDATAFRTRWRKCTNRDSYAAVRKKKLIRSAFHYLAGGINCQVMYSAQPSRYSLGGRALGTWHWVKKRPLDVNTGKPEKITVRIKFLINLPPIQDLRQGHFNVGWTKASTNRDLRVTDTKNASSIDLKRRAMNVAQRSRYCLEGGARGLVDQNNMEKPGWNTVISMGI